MVHPILDRIDARFLPPCDGEHPTPIDERYGSPTVVAPSDRPGLPHAPAEEAIIDTLSRPRAGPQPWTDAPADDRRYSYQPPYMDALATTLWLPRHPLSRLDLDDTVDVKRSLETSAGGAGELGASDLFICTDDGPVALHDSPHEIDLELAVDDAEQQALSPGYTQSAESVAHKSYFLAIPKASPPTQLCVCFRPDLLSQSTDSPPSVLQSVAFVADSVSLRWPFSLDSRDVTLSEPPLFANRRGTTVQDDPKTIVRCTCKTRWPALANHASLIRAASPVTARLARRSEIGQAQRPARPLQHGRY